MTLWSALWSSVTPPSWGSNRGELIGSLWAIFLKICLFVFNGKFVLDNVYVASWASVLWKLFPFYALVNYELYRFIWLWFDPCFLSLPWYNPKGWLGVKQQVTYSLTAFSPCLGTATKACTVIWRRCGSCRAAALWPARMDRIPTRTCPLTPGPSATTPCTDATCACWNRRWIVW